MSTGGSKRRRAARRRRIDAAILAAWERHSWANEAHRIALCAEDCQTTEARVREALGRKEVA